MNTSKNLYVFILAYVFMLLGECNSILARHLADKMYELQSILQNSLFISPYKPYNLAISLCPDYIYARRKLCLAFAKEWSGTMAEYAIGGVEEDIGICGETRDRHTAMVDGYCPSGTVFITFTDVRTHTADGQ